MSQLSFHQRHVGLLETLHNPEAMASILARASERHGAADDQNWTRVWGRLVDPQIGRARVLYQHVDHQNTLCTLDIGGPHGDDVSLIEPDLGPIVARFFPDDRGLPTLPAALLHNGDAKVVRYRPGKRCTLRRAASGDYIKVFPDDRGRRIQAEGEQLWRAAKSGAVDFLVARPLGFDEALCTYTQAEIVGEPAVDELFLPGGAALAGRLGEASASITTSGLEPSMRHDAPKEMRRTRRRADQILSFVPDLAEPMATFLTALERSNAELTPAPLRPIHGSPHPNQWLVAGPDLGLVDFDRLSLGDPELDVATFSGEVDFESVDTRDEVNASFEQGYRQHHGDLDRKRLDLYRAHKHLAKVHRTVSAIRVDGDVRATAHLKTATEALLPSPPRRSVRSGRSRTVIG